MEQVACRTSDSNIYYILPVRTPESKGARSIKPPTGCLKLNSSILSREGYTEFIAYFAVALCSAKADTLQIRHIVNLLNIAQHQVEK